VDLSKVFCIIKGYHISQYFFLVELKFFYSMCYVEHKGPAESCPQLGPKYLYSPRREPIEFL
jgi:hypothetical protein